MTSADNKPVDTPIKGPKFGVRHLQVLLLFLGLTISVTMRMNMSFAVVAMTDRFTANPDFVDYDWSPQARATLLSSFFWGYIITQIPSGPIAKKYGGKVTILIGVSVCSIAAICMPYAAELGGWQFVTALRVLQGLVQGFVIPSVHTLLSKWAPLQERSSLSSYVYVAIPFGTVIMLGGSGMLASSAMGWPSIFYIPAAAGLIWSVVWLIWGAAAPIEYKSITLEELKYIETSQGHTVAEAERRAKMKIPWFNILTSVPFLALLVSSCGQNWSFLTLSTQLPTFIKNVLKQKIEDNAIISAAPYLSGFIMSFVFLGLWTVLQKPGRMSLNVGRKVFNTIACWGPMISLFCLGFVGEKSVTLTIALLVVTVGINAAVLFGAHINQIDLSPNFAGILMGITNFIGSILSIISPLVVGVIVTEEESPEQWHIIFFIASFAFFIGNLAFLLFGKTEAQPWDDAQNSTSSNKRQSVAQVEAQN